MNVRLPDSDVSSRLRTVRRAAKLCRVPWRTLYSLIERGDLPVYLIDHVRFVDPNDVQELVNVGRLRQRVGEGGDKQR